MPRILSRRFSALVLSGCLFLGGCVSAASISGPAAQARDIRIRCIEGVDKADPDRQAAMATGTVVGMVTGIAAGQGDAGIALLGAYVGCEMGDAFVEAYKTHADKATVLLDPFVFRFKQAPPANRSSCTRGRRRRTPPGMRGGTLNGRRRAAIRPSPPFAPSSPAIERRQPP